MLSKKHRLQKTADFQRIHRKGKHLSGRFGKLIILDKDSGPSRFAVVVSADKGKAVKRNEAKRKLRELFRELIEDIGEGWDMFFVVWKVDFSYDEINKEIKRLLKNAIPNYGDD